MKDERVVEIPIDLVKNFENSRLRIEEVDLVPLMEDIKHRGLLQPIGVLQEGDNYIIRFGNRRLQACRKLGWKTISAILSERELNEDSFLADNIAENFHRTDLTPLELSEICLKYYKKGFSVSEISALLTIPKTRIESSINVSKSAPIAYKKIITTMTDADKHNKKGKISLTVAGEILNVKGFTGGKITDKQKEKLFEEAKQQELSAIQIRLIKNLMGGGMKFEEALKRYKEYKSITVEFVFDIKELNKYKTQNPGMMVKGFITGKNKPNKKLLSPQNERNKKRNN